MFCCSVVSPAMTVCHQRNVPPKSCCGVLTEDGLSGWTVAADCPRAVDSRNISNGRADRCVCCDSSVWFGTRFHSRFFSHWLESICSVTKSSQFCCEGQKTLGRPCSSHGREVPVFTKIRSVQGQLGNTVREEMLEKDWKHGKIQSTRLGCWTFIPHIFPLKLHCAGQVIRWVFLCTAPQHNCFAPIPRNGSGY